MNPYVVVVTDEDRRDPELFYSMLELDYGLRIPTQLSCRLLVVDPRVLSMPMQGEPVVALRPPPLKRKRAHQHRAGKRHRGQKAGVVPGLALASQSPP